MTRKKLVSKTLRIPQDVLEKIEKEASDKDIPISTLLSQVLTKYLEFDLFTEKANPVIIAEDTLLAMLDRMTPEQLEGAGNTAGSKVLGSLFALFNIKPTVDSVINYHFRPMGKYSGWFTSKYYEDEKKIVLHHSLGIKWSYFLKGHGASIRSVLKIEPKIDISESSAIIYLRNQT
ncbi:MAG: BrnA antitoxin family protein [Thaumarchaeota archaeon]|nr:BrnA antitoxin family protein [Nitrososphaerota archaeon]